MSVGHSAGRPNRTAAASAGLWSRKEAIMPLLGSGDHDDEDRLLLLQLLIIILEWFRDGGGLS